MAVNDVELSRLLELCRAGDELAWETLVRSYQGKVFGVAFHFIGEREEARDVAQLVFVRIYNNLHLCSDSTLFTPWILRITRNACIDQLRRRKARPPAFDVPAEKAYGLADGSDSPEQLSVKESKRRLLRRALLMLGNLNREIILLREIEGLTVEETATILGKPVGTIKSRLHRARLELAEKILSLTGGEAPGRLEGGAV